MFALYYINYELLPSLLQVKDSIIQNYHLDLE